MQVPPKITFDNIDRSPAIEAQINEHIDKLEQFFPHITSCRVVVEAPHRTGQPIKDFHVKIIVGVPGKELVVSRNPGGDNGYHKDVNVAVRDSFAAATRQLEDYVRQLDHRGQAR